MKKKKPLFERVSRKRGFYSLILLLLLYTYNTIHIAGTDRYTEDGASLGPRLAVVRKNRPRLEDSSTYNIIIIPKYSFHYTRPFTKHTHTHTPLLYILPHNGTSIILYYVCVYIMYIDMKYCMYIALTTTATG